MAPWSLLRKLSIILTCTPSSRSFKGNSQSQHRIACSRRHPTTSLTSFLCLALPFNLLLGAENEKKRPKRSPKDGRPTIPPKEGRHSNRQKPSTTTTPTRKTTLTQRRTTNPNAEKGGQPLKCKKESPTSPKASTRKKHKTFRDSCFVFRTHTRKTERLRSIVFFCCIKCCLFVAITIYRLQCFFFFFLRISKFMF